MTTKEPIENPQFIRQLQIMNASLEQMTLAMCAKIDLLLLAGGEKDTFECQILDRAEIDRVRTMMGGK